jgi:hypothetical protein
MGGVIVGKLWCDFREKITKIIALEIDETLNAAVPFQCNNVSSDGHREASG